MQRVGDDELDVVHAGLGREREDALEDHLARIGERHRRQRQRDVVDADRELHPRTELRAQRVRVLRVLECVGDRLLGVLQRVDGLRWVDDAAPGRETFETEPFTEVEERRRRAPVHLEDESGTATSWQGRTPPSRS
jgi:hypothetical protein